MPTHYFYGEDTYAARQAIGQLADKNKATIRWIDKDDLQQQSATDVIGQQGGLFGAILPVIRDPSTLSKGTQEALLSYLQEHTNLELVLWDRESSRRPAPLSKAGQAKEFSYEGGSATARWVVELVKERGGTIAAPAAAMLVARAGQNRWQLEQIIAKILLRAVVVTPDVIAAEIDAASEAEIFATLQAIVRRQKDVVFKHITALLEAGNSELYILSMLAWQFKILVTVKRGSVAGLNPEAIARQYNLKPFVVTKSLPGVQGMSYDHLLDMLTKILATDVAIKQGKVQAKTGLLMLILNLVQTP